MTTRPIGRFAGTALAVMLFASASWQPAIAQTAVALDRPTAERIARLDRDVSRAESVRAVKRLQLIYAAYAEFGLWNEMADLFAAKGELMLGDKPITGNKAILAALTKDFGGGRLGLAPGGVATRMQLTPVVNLSVDGRTAKGRWHEVSMLGQLGQGAHWEGGISENDYVFEDGRWKIARLHLYPMYAGTYEDGWRNLSDDLPVVPFHYTPDEAGIPIPWLAADAQLPKPPSSAADASARVAAIDARLRRMAAEDAVQRLQAAYGYYVDQKMWTDITDLFTADGTLEIAGEGIFRGEQGIRRSFGKIASNSLLRGEVNEHMQLETVVTISPDGKQAWARGFELSMLGRNHVGAWWTQAIFENRYVESGGVWRIASMRLFPKLRSDYSQGWGKSQLAEPTPAKGFEPDGPSTVKLPSDSPWVAAFNFPNPATGRTVSYPAGTTVLGTDPDATAAANAPGLNATSSAPFDDMSLSRLEQKLAAAQAVDATENMSHAFGYYLDDFNWDGASALFARTGRRGKYQIGFYVSPERIREAEMRMYGPPKTPRQSIQIHLRLQPVIDVGPDGMTTKLRTRLFSFGSSATAPGSFGGAVYPNDRMVMQDGVWKFQHQSIDEFYFLSAGYKGGWANLPEPKPFDPNAAPDNMAKLRMNFPPDVAQADMGIRGIGFAGGPDFINPPDVKPMWFHYANPVSGRLPPNYCPDQSTCYQKAPLFKDQQPTPAPPGR